MFGTSVSLSQFALCLWNQSPWFGLVPESWFLAPFSGNPAVDALVQCSVIQTEVYARLRMPDGKLVSLFVVSWDRSGFKRVLLTHLQGHFGVGSILTRPLDHGSCGVRNKSYFSSDGHWKDWSVNKGTNGGCEVICLFLETFASNGKLVDVSHCGWS